MDVTIYAVILGIITLAMVIGLSYGMATLWRDGSKIMPWFLGLAAVIILVSYINTVIQL